MSKQVARTAAAVVPGLSGACSPRVGQENSRYPLLRKQAGLAEWF